jgi:UDP-N-acetylglucosamine 2-epimerase (hydrolysing)
MSDKKKILFITGTRADFGKLKLLINACDLDESLDVYIFVTGMHILPKYGGTGHEVLKCNYKNVYTYINQRHNDPQDIILANTIQGLGNYVSIKKPDMLVVHGDRLEALAGGIVGSLNNIIVAHIEGGEVSGTIDEIIRHSISKLSHIHFVANEKAKIRLIQMGELSDNIYIIGSPDIDVMISSSLPSLEHVKEHYNIPFDEFALFIYHPVTTCLHDLMGNISEVIDTLVESKLNYVMIYPNNDPGSDIIVEAIGMLRDNPRINMYPTIRFESFLVLLKNSKFIIGNSSSGIREAPIYSVPTINIGTRQNKRFDHDTIINVYESKEEILNAIRQVKNIKFKPSNHFGDGKSTGKFMNIISNVKIWDTGIQKYFVDMD